MPTRRELYRAELQDALRFYFVDEIDGGRVERQREAYVVALVAAIDGSGSNSKKADARARYKKAFIDYVSKKDVLDRASTISPSTQRFRASDELKTPPRKSPPIPLTASDKLKSPPPSSVPLAAAAASTPMTHQLHLGRTRMTTVNQQQSREALQRKNLENDQQRSE